MRVQPGEMLLVPNRWWHFVASDPQTLMLNLWYQPEQQQQQQQQQG